MKIVRIPPGDTTTVYRFVAQDIQRALDFSHGETTHESILQELYNDLKQLWVIYDDEYAIVGAGLTEHITYPTKRIVRIVMLGGSRLKEWKELFEGTIVDFAKMLGCSGIEIIGRKGWIRVLKNLGYKPTYYHLLKEI